MKTCALAVMIFSLVGVTATQVTAVSAPDPTVYVVQKGDTLWNLSERFFKDPFFWPNLWSRNPAIGNPHFIYPGQKLRILPDRIEIIPVAPPPPQAASAAPVPPAEPAPLYEKTFSVTGAEGFITEDNLAGVGRIVATNHEREMVGAGDTVYTNIGADRGARRGDRFSIYAKQEIIHPTRHFTVGYKIIPLGTLELSEITPTGSRATITKSYQEIESGAILLPWRDGRYKVPLKAANRSISGTILSSLTGNHALGIGDVVYLDLGKNQGIEVGNMLYVVRDVVPDRDYRGTVVLPQDVVGALVTISVGRDAATALVIKNVETIFLGDRVTTVLPE